MHRLSYNHGQQLRRSGLKGMEDIKRLRKEADAYFTETERALILADQKDIDLAIKFEEFMGEFGAEAGLYTMFSCRHVVFAMTVDTTLHQAKWLLWRCRGKEMIKGDLLGQEYHGLLDEEPPVYHDLKSEVDSLRIRYREAFDKGDFPEADKAWNMMDTLYNTVVQLD